MKLTALLFGCLILLLSPGCTAAPSNNPAKPDAGRLDSIPIVLIPTDTITAPAESPKPEGTTSEPPEPVITAALQALSDRLGLSINELIVVSQEEVVWINTCLGAAVSGETCEDKLTPGYKLIVRRNQEVYEVHTDRSGTIARLPGMEIKDLPIAVESARRLLASQLGILPQHVVVSSVQAVDWPDACLGIPGQDEVCAQVITPGFEITFSVNGNVYVYHTDASGALILQMPPSEPSAGMYNVIAIWEPKELPCADLMLNEENFQLGCGDQFSQQKYPSPMTSEELTELANTFAPFEAENAAGKLRFMGRGYQAVQYTDQIAFLEWIQVLQTSIQDPSVSVKPILTYSRIGGIAGFCDEIRVTSTGWAEVSNCKTGSSKHLRLSASQLTILYQARDTIKGFIFTDDDGAAVDGLGTSLVFEGQGTTDVTQSDLEQLINLSGQWIDLATYLP